jgi:glucosyl-3-phosphoglycerate phosphatase
MRVFQAADEPLNAAGLEQARQAAAVLCDRRISRIICSDMLRALQTADIVSSTIGVTPEPTNALRERHFGALIGTSSADIDWDVMPLGGESLCDFVNRSCHAIQDAIGSKETVLIVAHGGTLHALLALLQVHADLSVYANANPLRFERHADGWQVNLLNPQAKDNLKPLTVS